MAVHFCDGRIIEISLVLSSFGSGNTCVVLTFSNTLVMPLYCVMLAMLDFTEHTVNKARPGHSPRQSVLNDPDSNHL